MDRDEQLAILQRHASNSPPTASPAPSQAPLSHAVTRAIIAGIGPALRDSFAALHRENDALKSEIAALKAERAGALAQSRADVAELESKLTQTVSKVVEILERHGLPTDALTAQPRRLS